MKTPHEMAAVGKEFSEQTALFAWAAMARHFGPELANDPHSYKIDGFARTQYAGANGLGFVKTTRSIPELKWLHAIKNQGHGDAIRGARSAAEGVRPGVFDVFLPVPMPRSPIEGRFNCNGQYRMPQDFAGLYIELKRPGKYSTSDAQRDFGKDMREAGYAAEICVGWEAARDVILRYLGRA